jgi:hypothetical protein
VTITGAYPHLYERALNLFGATPNRKAFVQAIKQWNSSDLDAAMAEARVIGGIIEQPMSGRGIPKVSIWRRRR